MRTFSSILGALFFVSCIVSPTSGREVFRCVVPGEPITFSDLPCTNIADVVELSPGSTITTAPLSDDEQIALNAFNARWHAAQAQRKRRLQQLKRKRDKNRTQQRILCDNARISLSELRSQRRRGYSVAQAPHLNDEERYLRRQIIDNC